MVVAIGVAAAAMLVAGVLLFGNDDDSDDAPTEQVADTVPSDTSAVTTSTLVPGTTAAATTAPTAAPTTAANLPPVTLDPNADVDGDQVSSGVEQQLGSDPRNPNSTPESPNVLDGNGTNTCEDQADNDLDGAVDAADSGCA